MLGADEWDRTGDYTVPFLAAIGFNLANLAIAALLARRARAPSPAGARAGRLASARRPTLGD